MHKWIFFVSLVGVGLIGTSSVFNPQDRLMWNRTSSAPTGLYWLSDDPFTHGRWAVVSARSDDVHWARERGYVGENWPLLKQVAGVPGDEFCRNEDTVFVNGKRLGVAGPYDSRGRELPVWAGCHLLSEAEIFLMNPNPNSLDGRYFGATDIGDLDGVATLVWQF